MRLFELSAPEEGTYIAVKFSDQTISNIKAFQDENDIPNPVPGDDLHATIIYSRLPIKWDPKTNIRATARPEDFQLWGSDTNYLVLELSSDFLKERFDKAIELGGTHDFDDYRPHITLSYDVGDFDIEALELPDFTLEIVSEYKDKLRDEED